MTLPRVTYAVILIGTLLWCATLLAAPYYAATSSPVAPLIYGAYHHICHQLPERSFTAFGEKLAVCARCSSIYFGFLFGTCVFPFVRKLFRAAPSRATLILATLPMLLDVGLDLAGLHESTLATRTISGAIFGIVVPFIVVPTAIEGMQQLAASKPLPTTTTINQQ